MQCNSLIRTRRRNTCNENIRYTCCQPPTQFHELLTTIRGAPCHIHAHFDSFDTPLHSLCMACILIDSDGQTLSGSPIKRIHLWVRGIRTRRSRGSDSPSEVVTLSPTDSEKIDTIPLQFRANVIVVHKSTERMNEWALHTTRTATAVWIHNPSSLVVSTGTATDLHHEHQRHGWTRRQGAATAVALRMLGRENWVFKTLINSRWLLLLPLPLLSLLLRSEWTDVRSAWADHIVWGWASPLTCTGSQVRRSCQLSGWESERFPGHIYYTFGTNR